MSELEQMREVWKSQGQTLAELKALNFEVLRAVRTERLGSDLRRWRRLPTYELVAGIVAELWLVRVTAGTLGVPVVAASGALLALATLMAVMIAARQLFLLAGVDYSAPVAEVQGQLERVQALRVSSIRWTLLLAPLLWTPLTLVGARAAFGVELEREVGWPWVLANLALGVAFLPLGWLALSWAARRWASSAFWRQLRDDVSGRSLAEALRSLEELAAFQREA